MLTRRGRGRAFGRLGNLSVANGEISPPRHEEDQAPEGTVRRHLPVSPIYQGGGPFATTISRGTGPRLARDKFYDHMCDWGYHTLVEFEEWMPEREWVKAVCDLVHRGWTFDRRGASLRMRKLALGERRPSVVELLSGVTLPDRLGEKVTAAEERASATGGDAAEAYEGGPFEPEEDVPVRDRLVLDEAGKAYLSIRDYVANTTAILARKGMGKTYLAMVIAECLLDSEVVVPFVVIDPTGCWSGLLANADGSPASRYNIALLGGEQGEFPLRTDAGAAVARVVVEAKKLPFILDLSLLRKEEQHEFVADFTEELYHLNRTSLHVLIDEADIFAPQRLDKSSPHHGRCLAAVDNLTRRGRFRGIGDTLVSQRPALVNKNLLSQVGSMFILHMIAPQDLNAVEDWLHDNIDEEVRRQCRADLPVLPRGTAYYLRGGEGSTFRRFKVRAKRTFDSSRTPEIDEERVVPRLERLTPEWAGVVNEFYASRIGVGGELGGGDTGEDEDEDEAMEPDADANVVPEDDDFQGGR